MEDDLYLPVWTLECRIPPNFAPMGRICWRWTVLSPSWICSSRIGWFHRWEWWSTRTIAVLIHSFRFRLHVSWGAMQQTKNCHGYVIFCQSECWSWTSLLHDDRENKCILLLIDWNGFCNGTRRRRHSFECVPWERRTKEEVEEWRRMRASLINSCSYIVFCTNAVHEQWVAYISIKTSTFASLKKWS